MSLNPEVSNLMQSPRVIFHRRPSTETPPSQIGARQHSAGSLEAEDSLAKQKHHLSFIYMRAEVGGGCKEVFRWLFFYLYVRLTF